MTDGLGVYVRVLLALRLALVDKLFVPCKVGVTDTVALALRLAVCDASLVSVWLTDALNDLLATWVTELVALGVAITLGVGIEVSVEVPIPLIDSLFV